MSASCGKNDANQSYQNQASHIDDHRNLLGVVQGSHFDLSRLEGKEDGDKLKQEFVCVGDTQPGQVGGAVQAVIEEVDLLNSFVL